MNRTYRVHPKEYAIGENERLYEAMAAKGWCLQKRGRWLSRFVKAEPEKRRYRIELSSPESTFLAEESELGLSEEQIDLYEECGWEFVDSRHLLHIFTAPENSSAPELYQEPQQQADTLKALRKQYRFSWILLLVMLAIDFWVIGALIGLWQGELQAKMRMTWVVSTSGVLAILLWYNKIAVETAYAEYQLRKLYRSLKAGKSLENARHQRHYAYHIYRWLILGSILFCLAATLGEWVQHSEYPLPENSEGPYILLEDLGMEGDRIQKGQGENRVEVMSSWMATIWDVWEKQEDGWMSQRIYRFGDHKTAESYADTLRYQAVFTKADAFMEVEALGLDRVYISSLECIVVRENWLCYVRHPEGLGERILGALMQRLGS